MNPSKKEKSTFRKWTGYLLNIALLLIILTFFIPSWRMAFQSWYQGMTLSEVNFEKNQSEVITERDQTWQLFDKEGMLYSLTDFRGKPIVLNFWATWCSYCRVELPEIAALKSAVHSDIQFISVTEETPQVIENAGLSDQYDFLFTTQNFPAFAKVNSYPTLIIIDSEMKIVHRQEGAAAIHTEKNILFLNGLLQN